MVKSTNSPQTFDNSQGVSYDVFRVFLGTNLPFVAQALTGFLLCDFWV